MCHLEVMFGSSRVVETPNNHSFKKLRACLSADKQFKADVAGVQYSRLRFSFCSAILMAWSSPSKLPHVHNMASDSKASSSHPSSEEEAAQKEKKK